VLKRDLFPTRFVICIDCCFISHLYSTRIIAKHNEVNHSIKLLLSNYRMRTLAFLALAVASAKADYVPRHAIVGARPSPVEFHGFLGLDLDMFRPPQSQPGIEEFRKEVDRADKEEHEFILHELDATRKVEQEFLNSDLHKEAVRSRLFPILV